MQQIYERAQSLSDQIVAWRRQIHENPEIGVDLPETVALVTKALQEMGLEPQPMAGGVVALVKGDKPGKTILLRGDMDALPMDEESGLPFASKVKGAAHTCGHDMHTAMLLGAAQILMENRDKICGTVKLMFQPGEEVGMGASGMVAAGVLEDPKVDAALGIHSMAATDIPSGKIALSPGVTLASSDLFSIKVTGKGGHGSRPETCIDPINILCHIHTMLQTINSREKPQKEAAVLTIGQFVAGDAANIIPNEGFMTGTIRTMSAEVRALVKKRLVEIAEGTAAMLGGKAEVVFDAGTPVTVNDEAFTQEVLRITGELLGEDNVVPMPSRMASEDFGEIASLVPASFARLSTGSNAEGYCYGGHHPKVVLNEAAMPAGAATYAYVAIRWLEEKSNER